MHVVFIGDSLGRRLSFCYRYEYYSPSVVWLSSGESLERPFKYQGLYQVQVSVIS